ncbi:NAD-dependent epimerase [Bradyrhizobium sp. Ai1a-2]|uniref:NAD-dependent epimerase n=1 Tax=Bradyrhizobium sp. Ai1a-2 TaxID=196490 RepID=UPI000421731F|nr:NAD-dependent epimerase [Bradyrhizobium sp. Ai1a-2]
MTVESILVTGVAGFIGFHVAERLLRFGRKVVGVDNMNTYYDPALKSARLKMLEAQANFSFVKLDVADRVGTELLFSKTPFSTVIHLAAQAGVRYSLENPHAYIDSNIQGFLNVLEGCRHGGCKHLLFASSSSVYGANTKLPFSVQDNVDHPISLYAASKKANELMAHAYSHLFGIPATGLRFFTVYGPWGRPDMAMYIFSKAILEGKPIKLFNYGRMRRDFTYIDDISHAVVGLVDHLPRAEGDRHTILDPSTSSAPWRVFNIGNSRPVELSYVISLLERGLGRTAKKDLLPMQPGDVEATYADVSDLEREIGFRPTTSIEEGVARFTNWYLEYSRAG